MQSHVFPLIIHAPHVHIHKLNVFNTCNNVVTHASRLNLAFTVCIFLFNSEKLITHH